MMLETLFGSKTRAAVLRLFLDEPGRAFHLRELVRAVGGGISSVQAEVERLEALGVLTSERDARGRRSIRLVSENPLVGPLAGLVAAEAVAAHGTVAPAAQAAVASTLARLNPRVRPLVPALIAECRRFGAAAVSLFGSATEPDPGVVPRDLDVLVVFEPGDARPLSDRYFGLRAALSAVSGLPVGLVEAGAVRNPYVRASIDETKVDLYA